ncbi:IS30 family transposase [uncultured Lactococcus sp.]|uniref:IS30 family transposase n=1 Tax=uncultured Lactococcus sp. TaxID=167973 RepID=UPI0035A90874
MTTDNGSEFAAHKWITAQLDVQVYFTDSFSSWQKGAVENTNKLIRQYIPKGTDISSLTDGFIIKVQKKINTRLREKLNFSTPQEEFFKLCV